MRAKDLTVGMRVVIRVSGRLQEATVRSIGRKVDRRYRYGMPIDTEKTVVRLSYVPPGNRGERQVERSPAACRPVSGSELDKRETERLSKLASKPRAPKRPAFERWHVMRPCSDIVREARAYMAAAIAYSDTATKQRRFLIPADPTQRKAGFALYLRNNLRAHLLRRATYLEIQLGRTFPSDDATRIKLAARAERHARSTELAGAFMGRDQAASWAGYLATGRADGYRGMS